LNPEFWQTNVWATEKVEAISVPESYGKIFKLTNVSYRPKNFIHEVHIPGKTYIAEAEFFIWHYMFDNLAQYLYLKKHIPDINYYAFLPKEYDDDLNDAPGPRTSKDFLDQVKITKFHGGIDKDLGDKYPHKYHEDIFDLFVTQKELYSYKYTKITFDEVYFVYDRQRYWLNNFKVLSAGSQDFGINYAYWHPEMSWESNAYEWRKIFNERWWCQIGQMELRKVVLDKIKDYPTDTPKKIFISRSDALKRYSVKSDKLLLRYHTPEINNLFEEKFKEAGYTILELEGMGYLEQANYFKNADHVAGLVGSGFCQTLYCSPTATVLQIDINPKYEFDYRVITDPIGIKMQKLDLTVMMNNHSNIEKKKDRIVEAIDKHIAYCNVFSEIKKRVL
jgi:hypothetical protein